MTNPHPLMEVRFVFVKNAEDDLIVTRWLYHVPRSGDWVELAVSDETVVGHIRKVSWHENYVEVGF